MSNFFISVRSYALHGIFLRWPQPAKAFHSKTWRAEKRQFPSSQKHLSIKCRSNKIKWGASERAPLFYIMCLLKSSKKLGSLSVNMTNFIPWICRCVPFLIMLLCSPYSGFVSHLIFSPACHTAQITFSFVRSEWNVM